MTTKPMTCWSCVHYRTTGCAEKQSGWPRVRSIDCWFFVYEPGSDEGEP